jgi:ribonuclease HII
MIVGIDEVGRGAWAGPLVVGAVLLGRESIVGLTDSKKLTKRQRERLDLEVRQKASAIGLGWVSAKQIDKIGLSQSLKLAARRALGQIRGDYQEIIIDGTIALIDGPAVTIMAKADLLIPSVSAASIVAKVARDKYMCQVEAIFPGYKFASHVGYGTAAHQAALEERGATPLHRLSFEPLREYRPADLRVRVETVPVARPSTKSIGRSAESTVAEHLRTNGHVVLDRNWRTKRCEIDIVSRRGQKLYFTEVKYRKNDRQGGGLAAITHTKLRQMKFAAECYLQAHNLQTTDACLAVADVTGDPAKLCNFLELR